MIGSRCGHKECQSTKLLREKLPARPSKSSRKSPANIERRGRSSIKPERTCQCQNSMLRSLLPLCRVIPLQTLGSSFYTTPVIALLRTLFPASPYSLNCAHAKPAASLSQVAQHNPELQRTKDGKQGDSPEWNITAFNSTSDSDLCAFSHLPERLSTQEFRNEIHASIDYGRYRVVPISWVKALASHMSHEFLQFVVEDPHTSRRDRLLSDRQETGDWVLIPPAKVSSSLGVPWQELSPYKYRHAIPLPLVSLTFDAAASRPALRAVADVLEETTERCPEYGAMREMCWWYAEAVMDTARLRFDDARVEEWAWARAKYRYSFVLCNDWVRRRLEEDASQFEALCAEPWLVELHSRLACC